MCVCRLLFCTHACTLTVTYSQLVKVGKKVEDGVKVVFCNLDSQTDTQSSVWKDNLEGTYVHVRA